MSTYTLIENAAEQIAIPTTGMVKKLLLNVGVRIMGFGFAPGHELKEHTAPADVILHFLEGEATVTMASETKHVAAGSLVHIPANLPHSVLATTALKMLLVLLPANAAGTSPP
ncbi:MAG: cupin domain-containing protein [Bryobacteraceae bacterium]